MFSIQLNSQVNHLVISQVYGGGGQTGAAYKNDFIELFNPTNTIIGASGYSVQYASAAGTSWQSANIGAALIGPGQYFLVQLASGGTVGANLPTPQATGTINMSATAGKVALIFMTNPGGSCPSGSSVIDFVGYGSANCFEGTAATPAPSNSTAIIRASNGCKDTDQNSTDFSTGTPTPRNSSSSLVYCSPTNLVVTSITPSSPTAGTTFNVTVQSQDLGNNANSVITATSFSLSTNGNAGAIGGTTTGTISAGTNSVTITGVTLPSAGTGVTITATVTSGDALTAGTSSAFAVQAAAAPTKFAITNISPSSPIAGSGFNVTIEAQDNANAPQNVSANTSFSLTNTGGGTISGTTTGTIAVGTNSVTISGVTLSTGGSGVTLTATVTSGDALTAGTSSAFTVVEPASQLAFVNAPSGGTIGTALGTFTVEARRPDNSLDNTYTSIVTITKASGPGTLSGTTSVNAISGIATFNNLSFNQTGAYTLSATSGALSSATSGTITVDNHLMISQVYGGGGNAGATYTNDFVELYNPSNSTISLSGYAIQYASATGTTWTSGALTGSIPAGKYFLIQMGGGATGIALPTADATVGAINMSGTAGKVALTNTTSGLTGSCPTGSTIVDFIGFGGTASCFEGSAAATPPANNATSMKRADNGCTDANQNSTDFGTGTVSPRNSASPFWSCTCITPTAFSVTGGGSYCTGGSGVAVGLSGSQAGNSYQLFLNSSPDGSPVTGTGSAISFGIKTVVGTYSVVATYPATNCTAVMTGSTTISINPLPTISISGTSAICTGNSTTLTASGASTYSWSNGDNTAGSTVSPSTNTTYSVTGIDANGCLNTASQLVTINELPIISITGNNAICEGTSTSLTATGASTYNWSNGVAAASNTVSPSTTTTYSVTGVDANGCAGTATQMVTVNANPTVNIGGVTTIVTGTPTTLNATGADTYSWNTGAITSSITVNPTLTTSYTVTGATIAGCVGQSIVTVTVTAASSPNGAGSSSVTTTNLLTAYCPANVSTFGSSLYCVQVANSTNYEYKFTESGTNNALYYTRGTGNTNVYLGYVAGLQYGKTYDVQVRAYVGGVWGVFGASCQAIVTGAPSSKLLPSFCGATIPSLGTNIYCESFLGATRYKFHIIDNTLGTDYTYISATGTKFIPQWIPQMTYGGSYTIEIALELNGVFGAYGTPCNITIGGVPTTQIKAAYCPFSSPTFKTTIYCDQVIGASAYEYMITNLTFGGTIFYTTLNGATSFYPHLVPGMLNNATYSISVRAISGSQSGTFGNSCTLTLGVPLRLATTDTENERIEDAEHNLPLLNVFPNPSNGNIKLETNRTGTYYIINELGEVVRTIEISDVTVTISVEGLAAGMYTVISNQADGFIRQKIVVTK